VVPRPERPRPNMDPRAKEVADSLHFELQRLAVAIPVVIVCIVIASITGARLQTIIWIALGGAVAYAAISAFVRWFRRALRTDPSASDEP